MKLGVAVLELNATGMTIYKTREQPENLIG